MQTEKKILRKELDTLLKTRFHGAVNIRGIRYQILYSVLRSFDFYAKEKEVSSIRLEGIEDVDLLGLRLGDEYIQVKSSQNSWNWSKLKEPIQGFLKVYRAEPCCHFVLAVNFHLCTDIARLAQIKSLPTKERRRVENKFSKLCHQIGSTTDESKGLMDKLTIVSMPEEHIWEQLRKVVADIFGLGSEAVDVYISSLVAKFLDWAKDRKLVKRADLESIRSSVGEALARETEFQAYGRGLIDIISWEPDGNIEDFFDGKGTRPGHIAADVDIKRTIWLKRIDKAINSSKICILRSSSGQGKSALLYRYAFEQWPANNTFILRVAELPEHVELIRNYLRFRAKLGLPILLLIDNAGWRTRLWSFVAQECAALGVRVLVTIRNEDWHRFALESLTSYEILEPTLDLDEARQIFKVFQLEGRLHKSIKSSELAYEKIGEPHLLIEYIYFLTHGLMLEERLRDQLKQFSEQNEDPAKIEILRRTALANALGAPVSADKMLECIELKDDPQRTLESLSGEYINIENGIITGLHYVRSEHIARILHEGYPNPEKTALSIIESILPESIPAFISNAMCRLGLNVGIFIKGLIEKAKSATLDIMLSFLDGIFEAGERQFFKVNQGLFDEAYDLMGQSGPSLLNTDFVPIGKVNTIDALADTFKDEKGENFRRLKKIAARVSKGTRGLDMCRDFLCRVKTSIQPETILEGIYNIGHILDWCFLCNVRLPAWPAVRNAFLADQALFEIPLKEFCSFSQGLYRYDESAYLDWFSQNRENIIGYLMLHTDCIELKISDSKICIGFFLDQDSNISAHQQAISRLKLLRSAVPFCEHYQSQGIWFFPFGLKPSVDETNKDISKENLPFKSDTEKNVIWRKSVESHYLPDSYYRYEESWYTLRCDALRFIQGFSKGLQETMNGRKFNFKSVFKGDQLLKRLERSLKYLPYLSIDNIETIGKTLSQPLREVLKEGVPNNWSSSFRNFFFQIFQYIDDRNIRTGKLAVYNFLDATKHLRKMHFTFEQLFKNAPDYFDASKLDALEIKAYTLLADLLDAWILIPLKTPQKNILQYIKAKRERIRQEIIRRTCDALSDLKENGITIIPPTDVYVEHPFRYLPIAFSVNNPCYPEVEVTIVTKALFKVKDIVDFFCLVPICKGERFLEDGWKISLKQIPELKNGEPKHWESFVPCKFPNGVLNCLPPLPFRPLAVIQIRAVSELPAVMPIFVQQKNKIESLKKSENHFEVELYNRHKARISKEEINFGINISEIKNYIKVEFLSLKDDSNLKTVIDFLEAVENASQKGIIDELLVSSNFNKECLKNSVEQLLERWIISYKTNL